MVPYQKEILDNKAMIHIDFWKSVQIATIVIQTDQSADWIQLTSVSVDLRVSRITAI